MVDTSGVRKLLLALAEQLNISVKVSAIYMLNIEPLCLDFLLYLYTVQRYLFLFVVFSMVFMLTQYCSNNFWFLIIFKYLKNLHNPLLFTFYIISVCRYNLL